MRLLAVALLAACASSPPPQPVAPPPKPLELRDADGHRLPFSKQHILAGMSVAKVAVGKCYDEHRQNGEIYVQVAITPDGDVAAVRTVRGLVGTPQAACVERAVRNTKFPPFLGAVETVSYPFTFR